MRIHQPTSRRRNDKAAWDRPACRRFPPPHPGRRASTSPPLGTFQSWFSRRAHRRHALACAHKKLGGHRERAVYRDQVERAPSCGPWIGEVCWRSGAEITPVERGRSAFPFAPDRTSRGSVRRSHGARGARSRASRNRSLLSFGLTPPQLATVRRESRLACRLFSRTLVVVQTLPNESGFPTVRQPTHRISSPQSPSQPMREYDSIRSLCRRAIRQGEVPTLNRYWGLSRNNRAVGLPRCRVETIRAQRKNTWMPSKGGVINRIGSLSPCSPARSTASP